MVKYTYGKGTSRFEQEINERDQIIFRTYRFKKGGTVLKEYRTLRGEIARLALQYLRDVLQDNTEDYGDYRVEDGEFRFCPREGTHIPADRVSEWNLSKTGGGKIRFFDKASAIALARSIGVFNEEESTETEDLSDEALFGVPEYNE